MGKKVKSTHIVQRAYLENFSFNTDGKKIIWRFDKTTRKTIALPIKKVLVENYFYPQEIEDWLANEVEIKGIKVIQKIIDDESLDFMEESHKIDIAKWILVQDLRTREYRDALKESYEMITKLIIEKDFIPHYAPELKDKDYTIEYNEDYIKGIQMNMMKKFEREGSMIIDYNWSLHINDTELYYYTSDNPIIKDNTYHKTLGKLLGEDQSSSRLGYLSKGIEFNIPISSKLCIFLFDSKPLFQYLKQNKAIWYILSDKIKEVTKSKVEVIRDNVIYLNERITANANKYILSEKEDFSVAQEFLKRNP